MRILICFNHNSVEITRRLRENERATIRLGSRAWHLAARKVDGGARDGNILGDYGRGRDGTKADTHTRTHTCTLALVPPRVAFVALHKANLLALANCLFGPRRALSRRHFST